MSKFVFPKPTNEDIFEDLVRDIYAREYENRNFQRYGRRGQKQFGVDSAGFSAEKLIGVQCKNHPEDRITTKEIDDEVTKSESFTPTLHEYIIATSADRDAEATKYVFRISQKRISEGKYPVSIKFWQDLCDDLTRYPDLVFKYFSRFFSLTDLENITFSPPKGLISLVWPVTIQELKQVTEKNIGGVSIVTPYNLSVGFSTFADTSFGGLVDLNLRMADLFGQTDNLNGNFTEAATVLNKVKASINDPYFSKDLLVYVQARLSAAFLFGWVFRKVTKFNLKVISGKQIWATEGLPYVKSNLFEFPPQFRNSKSDEAVFALSVSRNINQQVIKHVDKMDDQPRIVLSYGVDGFVINSAAQALSFAEEVAKKIKMLIDEWEIKKIHLFAAIPGPLALLIGYHLNGICPIGLYFLDAARDNYRFAGEINNSL